MGKVIKNALAGICKFEIKDTKRNTYIVFEGVSSCVELYINDIYAGYSQGSHLQAEFDITDCVKEGKNTVTAKVLKWCSGSYLEDQDFLKFNGIFRDVYILQRPFDHITEFPCKGKSIAMAGLEGNLLLHFVKVSKQFDRWETSPTKSWMKEKGGVLKDDVTLKCDYLVVGPSATMDVMKVTKAVRYRDSGKSLIKIFPEDEVLQILDAEDQAISK